MLFAFGSLKFYFCDWNTAFVQAFLSPDFGFVLGSIDRWKIKTLYAFCGGQITTLNLQMSMSWKYPSLVLRHLPVSQTMINCIIISPSITFYLGTNLVSVHFIPTVSALLEVTDSWSLNIDRGLVNAVIFLDLKKAFDTMDHNILLSKLQFYGINKWFSSYLKRRTQTCLVNCNKSSERLNRYPLRNILAYILIKI